MYQQKKNKEKTYENIIEISQNNDYPTGNLLDYEYFSKHYKLIAIDLSKQIELENPNLKQQINLNGKLEEDEATMFFIVEKSEETTFEFLQNSLSIIQNGNTKVHKLVNDSTNEESKFATKKCYFIDSQTAKGKYNQNNSIKFERESIRPSISDYSDAFALVTGDVTVTANNNTDFALKNCAPFSTCKAKINDVFVDEANQIHIAMPMYNLIGYSDGYSDT